MEVGHRDGTNELWGQATFEKLQKALKNPETKSVTLHKAGNIVEKDGLCYRVNEAGAFERIDNIPHGKVLVDQIILINVLAACNFALQQGLEKGVAKEIIEVAFAELRVLKAFCLPKTENRKPETGS